MLSLYLYNVKNEIVLEMPGSTEVQKSQRYIYALKSNGCDGRAKQGAGVLPMFGSEASSFRDVLVFFGTQAEARHYHIKGCRKTLV
jgi:hypothetical protein